MWFNWNDFDRHFTAIDALRRQIERGVGPGPGRTARWAEPTVYDNGESYVFAVDVPGVKADDLTIDVHEATITVSATRTPTAPEGYATQRSERAAFEWKRSFTLPAKIDNEKTSAKLEHGVLTVTLSKLPEAKPRRIAIA
ncbi:MAG: Hsp20/alpha crystallin family protein [Myxococcales bacterium]|nr:Hsp20/alpha crystallin family protein [Myxococcales bacterium]MCB9731060.1 Hsp20/alpha crystallin family protein [Deltaproteobacteria bacterium]